MPLTKASDMDGIVQLITVFILFLFVLLLTYYTTKWVARYEKGKWTNRNIDVIETYKLTPNKYIQIIKAGEKYLVIALCKDQVCMLSELTEEQIQFTEPKEESHLNFKEILEKTKNIKTRNKQADDE